MSWNYKEFKKWLLDVKKSEFWKTYPKMKVKAKKCRWAFKCHKRETARVGTAISCPLFFFFFFMGITTPIGNSRWFFSL